MAQTPIPFSERLAARIRERRNPVVVGLDPQWASIPSALRRGVDADHGADVAKVYRAFCLQILDAVGGLVPAVKPQLAFFEELGPRGLDTLLDVIDYARSLGLIVILDGKRGDIGSTASAYARAYLGAASPWRGDALTVNPYLGHDTLEPFEAAAVERGAGVFVLVKTSNPGSAALQDLAAPRERVYRQVARHVETMAARTSGPSGYGAIGAVVGATYPEQLAELRAAMPHAWLLVPGYGAQGAKACDVALAFDREGLGAVVNSSRAILYAFARPEYGDRFGEARWQDAAAEATRDMIDELAAARG
ncbi:MAG: orotidine-5'-phosphate decarboxylase [Planctomycetes bacterium]|nr:orotidine-5'-phosphate decarboxylase [Planctomycetota bacterium]